MSLTIIKSSAGSGKTYTLAKEYLRLALRAPDYYKRILAVTFTNRAAEEMKERVLEFLIALSKDEHELSSVLAKNLEVSEKEVQQRALQTLSHLLHNYGFFSITTIDTFFHRVIRSFSREIGLQGSFGIELDNQKVTEFIASDLYEGVEGNKQLKNWLVDFSMHRLGDGKGYEFKNEVQMLASQLFSDEFKKSAREQLNREDTKARIKELQSSLFKTRFSFESTLKKLGQRFFAAMESNGLGSDELKGSGRSALVGFFRKLTEKNYKGLINKTVENAAENATEWSNKTSNKKEMIRQFAETTFIPLLSEAIAYYSTNEEKYLTANAVLKHLYTLGLLTDMTSRLQAYKREKEVIMISDLPDFLTQIIDDSDAPFIYEKVGSRYAHFLIDEFQDTSIFQWSNFRPLIEESMASDNENFIVGDAKQSIYGFRGGDPSLLITGISQDIPATLMDDSKSINYRSSANIVEFNNALFSGIPVLLGELTEDVLGDYVIQALNTTYDQVTQEVAEKNKNSEGLVHIEFLKSEYGESWQGVALEELIALVERLQREGHSLNDMVILVRKNEEASTIVNGFIEYKNSENAQADISYEVISADGMLIASSTVVQLLLTTFRYLQDPNNEVCEKTLIFQYQQVALGRKLQLHQEFSGLTPSLLPEVFNKYKEHLLHLPVYELTEVLIRMFKLDSIESEYTYLQAFQDAVLDFSKNNRSDIRSFIEWWKDEEDKRSVQLTGAMDAVEVITLHKSKGLQYPIVIIPFCNFSLDSQSHMSWYASPEDSPYNVLEAVPIAYSQILRKTKFTEEYKHEVTKWYLEHLNMLYVSFTRAEKGLFAFCQMPSQNSGSGYEDMSKLLWSYFDRHQPEGWSETQARFIVGKLVGGNKQEAVQPVSLTSYPSFKWSNRLTIRKTGRTYFDKEAEEQRNEGILLHQLLSEVIHWKDADEVLDTYQKRMEITREDRDNIERIFADLWKNDEIKDWFSDVYQVKTEVVVLPEDGEVKRMDRVLIKGKEAKVIDFKSGKPKSTDKHQVREYIELLGRMGYEANGYLLCLKSGEITKV